MYTNARGTVYVVHRRGSVRKHLAELLESELATVTCLETGTELLRLSLARPCCVVLDLRLCGHSGLEVQQALRESGSRAPMIFLAREPDLGSVVQAMKSGAFDFLPAPAPEESVVQSAHAALDHDRECCDRDLRLSTIEARIALLSNREREVLSCLAAGYRNQGMADKLGITRKTIEMHRLHLMRKMRADSLAALLQDYFLWFHRD